MVQRYRSWATSRSQLVNGLLGAALATLLVTGCSDDDDDTTPTNDAAVSSDASTKGAIVVCPVGDQCPSTVSDVTRQTYADLAARWWQWLFSIPADKNPAGDTIGTYCAESQPTPAGDEAPIWFLAGSTGGDEPIVRSCTIPSNRSLFFPVFNFVSHPCFENENCTGRGFDDPDTCPGQDNTTAFVEQDFASFSIYDVTTDIQLLLDGEPYTTIEQQKAETDVFEFTGVASEDLAHTPCTSGTRYAKTNGYWAFIEPLAPSPEPYVLRWTVQTNVGFSLDITYNLTVVEPE